MVTFVISKKLKPPATFDQAQAGLRLGFLIWLLLLASTQLALPQAPQTGTDLDSKLGNLVKCRSIIIVRHAEYDKRATDNKKTPATPLSKDGRDRARELAKVLKDAGITKAFVSTTRRTEETARDSVNALQKCDKYPLNEGQNGYGVMTYVKDTVAVGDVVLIVCHSHQIPPLLKGLGVEGEDAEKFDETRFDKIFVLFPERDMNRLNLVRATYGGPSKAPE
jgi:phosphohistidine phosphatase SixA